uniref:Uncharacterized protein n=1 Tax=Anguilla anguilla TaxID=7936 RepID=A0A0E9RHW4_ANGAN
MHVNINFIRKLYNTVLLNKCQLLRSALGENKKRLLSITEDWKSAQPGFSTRAHGPLGVLESTEQGPGQTWDAVTV